MLSRWTNFLTEDGEKAWRTRDAEFEARISDRKELVCCWNEGWNCLFEAIEELTDQDMEEIARRLPEDLVQGERYPEMMMGTLNL